MESARRQSGRIVLLRELLRAAFFSAPGLARPGFLAQVAGFVRLLPHIGKLRPLYGQAASPALLEVLQSRPSLVSCVERPYLNLGWSAQRKLDVIRDHYGMLREELGFLRFDPASPTALANLGEGIRLELAKPVWFQHDGELTICLICNEVHLFSLSFTLGEIDSKRIAYVGALQGICSPDAIDIYRSLTRRMQGLRPRDLLVSAFRMLCTSLGVARILAVSDAMRVSSSPYFTSSTRVFTSYDSAWLESGGVAIENGFFELSPRLIHRTPEMIPARKRALYRRRYEMLDVLNDQILQGVARAARAHTRGVKQSRQGLRRPSPEVEAVPG